VVEQDLTDIDNLEHKVQIQFLAQLHQQVAAEEVEI
jgi:hypothetical protein